MYGIILNKNKSLTLKHIAQNNFINYLLHKIVDDFINKYM